MYVHSYTVLLNDNGRDIVAAVDGGAGTSLENSKIEGHSDGPGPAGMVLSIDLTKWISIGKDEPALERIVSIAGTTTALPIIPDVPLAAAS